MGAYDTEELAAAARAEMVREIAAEGAFAADPGWREPFARVPRHLFVPYYFVAGPRGYERRWGESPDPRDRERWVRGAYADEPLATRLRDGELLSSSSQPSLMARMLAALRVTDGERVLEVGAGTGYNAALLARRLGDDDLVTSVELEPEITESARTHLAAAGYRPVVVTGDGARGVPERAPFDRIIATCALDTVPRAWLAQCRPGARVLLPLATGLLALTVRDAAHAEGRFLATAAYFVPLRGQGRAEPEGVRRAGLPSGACEQDTFRFLLALGRGALDPREAYALWERERAPGRERYGVTLAGAHGWAWLDDPEGPYTWPLP
ncbi:methyltransferase domain-containing protein [Streptomyces sp. SID8366]|uniref:methyltransferase domain-containing protein n=1 Tax=unclassified Streptomyces TaxID=2593676 RepID=UPI000DB91B73|nr:MULTISPECIES: methyltransferase domain-containing protein [unclassified Streptomyces]MYU08992.1 methyltransferase domain-containing protein [Streptomyces sp. SID8366]MYU62486.1 methyltransferase domain-containing protein [Streptomyces sp. SID69]RAJ52501.1 protein-L-isoaspartate(D-aspartate) O-methyltransferase [Streptomyces sp. PsTaAH-130]